MLAMVAAMAVSRRASVPAGHVDPHVWWHVGRASGLIAWALLGASVLGGVSLSTSLAGRRTRSWTTGLHTFVAVLAVVFTGVHMAAVLAADELRVGWVQLVVPFTRASAPFAQAAGVVAGYLLLAVALTSWLRGTLPWRWWRRLHLLSFPLFAMACVHTVLAGSDADHPVLLGTSAAAGAVLLVLLGYRLLVAGRRRVGTLGARGGAIPAVARAESSPVARAESSPVGGSGAGLRGAADPDLLTLTVNQVTWEAEGVVSLVLAAGGGVELPSWEPGAHVELALPSGRVRHYSLFGDPAERTRYRVAVLRQDDGRGGSREIHRELPVGTSLAVRPPRNNFRLEPSDAYLFVAGGIGITGVLEMARTVAARGERWRFVYGGRSLSAMAFVEQVRELGPDRVDIVPMDQRGLPDLEAEIAAQPPGTGVYCCGPPPLLAAVTRLVGGRPDLRLHVERFSGVAASGGAVIEVALRRSGHVVQVAPDESILTAVRRVLPSVRASCEQGICGSCRSVVLAGEPEHRDQLLSDAERAAGEMLICVSRSCGGRLTLDL